MFENGNRVRFDRSVDAVSRDWWLAAFHAPFGLTPEGMGDLLTRSVGTEKSIVYRYIDGYEHAFALRVEGRLGSLGEIWFVERSLSLDGPIFTADEMFVAPDASQAGLGRRLMGDLLAASRLLGIARVSVEAQRIGRYAWLRMGFIPDGGSWRTIQLEAPRFIMRHAAYLDGDAPGLIALVLSGKAATARSLAALPHLVPSLELYDDHGVPVMVALGKAFYIEAAPNWTGEFNFDPDSVALAERYVASLEDDDG